MSYLVCPHCRKNDVPHGATVCSGCQAEIEYGVPNAMYGFVLVLSLIAGFKTSTFMPATLSFSSWIVGAGVFIGVCVLLGKMYKNRVVFKRHYRTK